MSNYLRTQIPGGTYFFTVVTEQRRPILTNADVRKALHVAIVETRRTRPFRIDGWVLLPDHLHCIWTLPDGDADFSTRWKKIKRDVSVACAESYLQHDLLNPRRRTKGHSTLWQHRFWEHAIANEQEFKSYLDYLHWNPMKHGLITRILDWPWSSFHRYMQQGVYSADWCIA
ncbi:REP-associated tyrosine transposase [Silvimonas soli]|uniref:REP-associated tyrosine transposase n=1 Tax=Silvimonas soli TaxID=2980100 RepID=UPI0024B3C09A|nr:transposase [Silvimonas soli]